MTAIVWYRDDLRISDHPALHAAAKTHAPIVCIYVLDDRAPGVGRLGARRDGGWRGRCVPCRRACVSGALHWCCGKGPAPKIIAALARDIDADSVYWNDIAPCAAPGGGRPGRRRARRERRVHASLPRRPAGNAEPDPQQGEPRPARVHAVLAAGAGAGRSAEAAACAEDAERRTGPRKRQAGRLEARADRSRTGPAACATSWKPGEASAQARLEAFLDGGIAGYASDRDRPDRDGTSRLSPHLRFGEISPRQIWHAARFAAAEHPRLSADIEKFLSELGWREFCRHLLFDVPDLATRNLQPSFDSFPMEARCQSLARVAARPDRLSHRRCRHARTLAHRRDAQPGADGGGVVPGQASADRLARWRAMVLGYACRCRCRQQPRELAMGGRLRRRRRALFPRLQSDPAGREVRSRWRLCQALGAGA